MGVCVSFTLFVSASLSATPKREDKYSSMISSHVETEELMQERWNFAH